MGFDCLVAYFDFVVCLRLLCCLVFVGVYFLGWHCYLCCLGCMVCCYRLVDDLTGYWADYFCCLFYCVACVLVVLLAGLMIDYFADFLRWCLFYGVCYFHVTSWLP